MKIKITEAQYKQLKINLNEDFNQNYLSSSSQSLKDGIKPEVKQLFDKATQYIFDSDFGEEGSFKNEKDVYISIGNLIKKEIDYLVANEIKNIRTDLPIG